MKSHCRSSIEICTSVLFCSSFFILKGINESDILGSLDRKRYLEKLMSYLDPVLQSSDRSVFLRCWHANTDGWASPTVTIIKVNDYIFGGYTDVSWNSSEY